ncbi:MAG: PHP domain-containing protein, partial [Planctomycetota bacterium]
MTEQLEQQLDSFNAGQRERALAELCEQATSGYIELPEPSGFVNIHCHTFFSYNAYGYSPSKFAWLARKAGLAVVGTVDFDVLDALNEFRQACRLLGLKGCSGLETRVFVPEFATRVINSPGEPGISYHMGVGFPNANVPESQTAFLQGLKEMAQQRNRDLMGRVNKYLRPAELDYERDVLTLTPAGNATERHMCLAYARKAVELFGAGDKLAEFWTEKLGVDAEPLELPEGRDLLNTIRAKTMKRGGVGYVQPDKGSFPLMADTNRFIGASGGMPVHTWLDGTSDGEQAIEELLD